MRAVRAKPCDTCPFRREPLFDLRSARVIEIAEVLRRDGDFACHKTTGYVEDEDCGSVSTVTEDSLFCAGAVRILEKEYEDQGGCLANAKVRILSRYGSPRFNPDEMDTSVECYDSFEEYIDILTDLERDRND